MIKNIWCRSGATLLSLWFCFWWDARSGRINAPSRFIHVKIFCSFRPQTSLELGTTNKSRREQKSTLLERLLKLSPHKFILRAVCQDSAHTHTQTETVGGGVCALEPSSCQMWGFGWRKRGFFGWGGGGCQKLQTRTDHSRVTTNIYLEPTRVLPPVRSRVLVHALTTANRKHTRAFSKVQKKSFTARCCCCWTAAAQPPLHTSC